MHSNKRPPFANEAPRDAACPQLTKSGPKKTLQTTPLRHHPQLLRLFRVLGLLNLGRLVLALHAHDAATPTAAVIGIVVEGGLEVLAELLELRLILPLDARHRHDLTSFLYIATKKSILCFSI